MTRVIQINKTLKDMLHDMTYDSVNRDSYKRIIEANLKPEYKLVQSGQYWSIAHTDNGNGVNMSYDEASIECFKGPEDGLRPWGKPERYQDCLTVGELMNCGLSSLITISQETLLNLGVFDDIELEDESEEVFQWFLCDSENKAKALAAGAGWVWFWSDTLNNWVVGATDFGTSRDVLKLTDGWYQEFLKTADKMYL